LFTTGLRKTIEWYLENKEWVEKVKLPAHRVGLACVLQVNSGEYQRWLDEQYRE